MGHLQSFQKLDQCLKIIVRQAQEAIPRRGRLASMVDNRLL